MNKFFKLNRDYHKGDIYIDSCEMPEYIEENYTNGISLAPVKESLKFFYKYKTSRKTDYLAGNVRYPIISTKFKEILTDISQGFLEFFPVQLVCERTNELDTSYFFLNIVNNIPCINREQSKYDTFCGNDDLIVKVDKLVIKPDVIKGRDIFRIKELHELLFVSEKLRSILEKEAIIGTEFIIIEDVTVG